VSLSICLLLDPRSDRAVRALWQRLETAGVPTLLSHTHGRHVPHLTLASLRSWDLDTVRSALLALPATELAPVDFDGLGTFRRSRSWLVPAPTTALLEHQRRVVEAVRRDADLHRHYEPGAWVPHLTLAPRLHLQDLPVVAKLVYDVLPLHATLTDLTLIDTSTGTRHPLTRLTS
jgi:2'-5' RNA ligase